MLLYDVTLVATYCDKFLFSNRMFNTYWFTDTKLATIKQHNQWKTGKYLVDYTDNGEF